MNIKKITDLEEARKIWEILSPKKTIYDDWKFRYIYYSFFNYPLAFYTAFNNEEPVALLPLQYNIDKKYEEFFGGGFMEDNAIYFKPGFEKLSEKLINFSSYSINLEWMIDSFGLPAQISEYKYYLNLQGLNSKEDYINKYWSGKSKQNLNAQIRKLSNRVVIKENQIEDLDSLIQFNLKRFGKESSFNFPHREDFLKQIAKNYDSLILSIYVDGNLESVGFSVLYNGIYNGFNSGTNNDINGLGKLLIVEKIDQAIKCGAKIYDARAENLGWKEAFHFSKRPQYKFVKP